jgi:hypothetical protein
MAAPALTTTAAQPEIPQYHTNLRAPIATVVGPTPHAKVHRAEVEKVRQAGGAGARSPCYCCLGGCHA